MEKRFWNLSGLPSNEAELTHPGSEPSTAEPLELLVLQGSPGEHELLAMRMLPDENLGGASAASEPLVAVTWEEIGGKGVGAFSPLLSEDLSLLDPCASLRDFAFKRSKLLLLDVYEDDIVVNSWKLLPRGARVQQRARLARSVEPEELERVLRRAFAGKNS